MFFHLRHGPGDFSDEGGVELPDFEAAYLMAFRTAYDMSGELLRAGKTPTSFSFEIVDCLGALVLELPF